MKGKLLALALASAIVGGIVSSFVLHARAQVVGGVFVPPPEKLRFRMVGDEPIATSDGRSIVNGYKVMVFRDTGSGQCYVTFITGNDLSATGPGVCP
jgi:hypothetical protein